MFGTTTGRVICCEVYSVVGYEELLVVPRYDMSSVLDVVLTCAWEVGALTATLSDALYQSARAEAGGSYPLLRFLNLRSDKRMVRRSQTVSVRREEVGYSWLAWVRARRHAGFSPPEGQFEERPVAGLEELAAQVIAYLEGLKAEGVAELL